MSAMDEEARVHAAIIRERLREDYVKTLRQHLGQSFLITGGLLDALTDDAMHHVELLLVGER